MLVINSFFGRNLGGIETAFCDYARVLTENGIEVINIINKNAALKEHLKWGKIIEVNNFFKYDFLSVLKLKKLLKKYNPNYIIAHGNRSGFLFSLLDKKKLICVSHNDKFKKHHQTCFANFVVNSVYKKQLEALGKKNVFVIPNMVEVLKEVKKPKTKQITIGTLARLHRQKGVDLFLQVVAVLNKKYPKVKYIVGGDGDEKQNLAQQQKELGLQNLEFIGWVKDKKSFYEKLDIYVQPSRYEPFGIVLLEAFNYEVPVVATNNDGPKDIITDGVNGILCENENVNSIAGAIESLIQAEEKKAAISKNAKILLKENYSFEVVGKKLKEALYAL